ncbi:MAG: hypothetical protein CME64_06355 [Halobacteriovoraceae bacterium]|nr:hypothetical protein [Halobacteriovoraceae bacterium]
MKLILIALLVSSFSFAKKIQIIHTNDLHSFYFGPTKEGDGGYARVKTLIDKLKADANRKGIPSLVLDAGDFGEGSYQFLFDNGIGSFKALDMLGIDAAVVGNHDHMFGGKMLSDQIKESGVKTQLLGANIATTADMKLKGLLKPNAVFDLDVVRVDVIGLTTDSLHFMHQIRPGFIFPPAPVSRAYSKIAREDNSDLIIALTHIGLEKDKKLAKDDPELDLIIGGHSHTRLEKVVHQTNQENRNIPIVQTGAHAMAVGSLILDLKGPKDVEVVSYNLHDALADVAEDEEVKSFVDDVDYRARRALAGNRWNEVIGKSEVDLAGYVNGKQERFDGCWLEHLPKIIQEESDSNVGLYLPNFTGKAISKGNITYGNIVENFPHINEYGRPGWEIMKFKVNGWKLYTLLLALVSADVGDSAPLIGGVEYSLFTFPDSIPWIGGVSFFTRLKINGKTVDFSDMYEVALPFEFSRMLEGLLPKKFSKLFTKDFVRGDWYLWNMAENYIKKHEVISCR